MAGERMPRLLAAALDAASRGWAVFPVWPGSKRPAIRGWQHHASTDPVVLRIWWRRPYNIGIACGPSGLLVVDYDDPATARHGWLPTYTVATPRGEHWYYSVGPERPGRCTAGILGSHVDTRAIGGYVVGAGSVVHTDGHRRRYRAISGPAVPLRKAPGCLLDALDAAARPVRLTRAVQGGGAVRPAGLSAEVARVAAAEPGTRNSTVFSAALRLGRLVTLGVLTEQQVVAGLIEACTIHIGLDGFTAAEARRAVVNGLRYAAAGAQPLR